MIIIRVPIINIAKSSENERNRIKEGFFPYKTIESDECDLIAYFPWKAWIRRGAMRGKPVISIKFSMAAKFKNIWIFNLFKLEQQI